MTIDPALDPAIPPTPGVVDPEHTPAGESDSGTGLARATTILAFGNIASRALGFVKEILLSNYFGASGRVDAFQIAITVPQDLYDLAINGHVNSALVPTLTEYAVRDRAELWRLVSALLGLVTLFSSGLVLVMWIFAPQIITLWRGTPADFTPITLQALINSPVVLIDRLAHGSAFTREAFDLSVHLLRLTAPSLLFMSLFAVVSGMLYALRRFTFPAFAAALFNGTIVVLLVMLAPIIGIEAAAIGWLVGAFAQLALQFGGMRGARLRMQLFHPGIRRIAWLYAPVLLSLVVDVLINRPFSYNVASQTGEGNIAYMNWATSLREFPMGLVGTAISVAILPTLARQALSGDTAAEFKATLGQGIRLALTLIIPATFGLFVLAGPLIGLLFERGAFTAEDTTRMSLVLRLYLLGIPFAAVDLLLIFAFYARKDSLTPALIGIFSLACYIVITLVLRNTYGFLSLMIADSLKHLIHMTISLMLLRRRMNGLGSQRLVITFLKIMAATVVMSLITYLLSRSLVDLFPVQGFRERFVIVIVPSVFGAAIYFILASLLRLDDFMLFIRTLTRRVRG
jgi:putative peptidoglycan lipid II flippase